MTISTLINSLAWGSSAQPRLRASLIKDQYGFAVYFSTAPKETWSALLATCQNDIDVRKICINCDSECKMRPFAGLEQ